MSSRWPIVILGIGLAAVSTWAFRTKPTSNLVGANLVAGGTIIDAHTREPLTAWDMELRLDPGIRPPGWGWILHEGRSTGEGYELHWLETSRVLQIIRARPVPFLLGAVTIPVIPERVTFRRRGGELSTLVDGVGVLRCLDPIGIADEIVETPRAFGCTTLGTLGDALLTVLVYQPRKPMWGSDLMRVSQLAQVQPDLQFPGIMAGTALDMRPDRAFLLTRQVFQALDAPDADGTTGKALGEALVALNPLDPALAKPSAGVRERLSLWLALARARYALARESESGEASLSLIEELITRSVSDPSPERIGVLLSLTEALAKRATSLPEDAQDPIQVAGNRARWLDLLHLVAGAARSAGKGLLAEAENARLDLLAHGTACLRTIPGGAAPDPRPVDAPAWLAVRWRAFAGEDPQAEDLPPMPEANSPSARAIELLAVGARITPVSAVGLRRKILNALRLREQWSRLGREGREGVGRAEAEVYNLLLTSTVPPRERILTSALVALRLGTGQPKLVVDAWLALGADKLADRDPLAFALRQLLRRRFPDQLQHLANEDLRLHLGASRELLDGDAGPADTSVLAPLRRIAAAHPQAPLLDGSPAAVNRIWLARTAPAEALAAALIMQDILGRSGADWSLLDRVVSLTLPLHLLLPPVERSAETDGTP